MSVVDDGSAAHWTADHLEQVPRALRQVARRYRLLVHRSFLEPMTMEFALAQALLKPRGGVQLRP